MDCASAHGFRVIIMEEKSIFLQFVGDTPISRVIDFLVENMESDFSKSQIAEGAEISRTALFKYWETIEQFGLVKVTRTFGKTKLYVLNTESPLVQQILDLDLKLIEHAMDAATEEHKDAISIHVP